MLTGRNLVLLLCACSSDDGWRVANGFVRDPDGRAVILRGVNVSGEHKHAPYLDFHGPADFARLRDEFGFNAVRFLLSWAAIEPEADRIDGAYLDAVAERMAWARDARLLVVLDMHQDLYGEGFAGANGAPRWTCDEAHYAAYVPITPWFLNYLNTHIITCFDGLWTRPDLIEHYRRAWRAVAARLAAFDNVIGFDVINEPFWGSYPIDRFEADRLAPFYDGVIAAVRAEAPWLAFVEPASSRNIGLGSALPPLAAANVVYAPHAYDAAAEAGGGFDPTHRQAYLDNVASLAAEARTLGAALWIGEYGGIADAGGIGEYMDAAYDAAGMVAAGAAYWHYGKDDGYGLLGPAGEDKPALLDALVRPYPERIAGDPIAWTYEDGRFTLVYRSDPSVRAPTEIAVPGRAYPMGAAVTCDSCTVEAVPGVLRITSPPHGDPATVVVYPLLDAR